MKELDEREDILKVVWGGFLKRKESKDIKKAKEESWLLVLNEWLELKSCK